MEDYVIFKLTGEYATDYSMAGRTMAFDVKRKSWSEEIFGAAGVDPGIMPPAYPSGTPVGKVTEKAAKETGLNPGTIVATGGHDHGCGALSAGVFDEGSILNSIGTAEALITVLNSPVLADEVCDRSISVYHHPASGRYQAHGGLYFSGGSLDWAIGRLGMEKGGAEAYAEAMRLASSAEVGSNGLFYLPHLRGASRDPHSRGAYVGLLSSHTRDDILRATIEGLCFELKDFVVSFENFFNLNITKIVAIGGATASDFWMQTKSDVTGCPIEVPGIEEATSLGAAILAGIASGLYSDHYQAYEKTYRVRKVFEPEPTRSRRYEELYEGVYQKLYGTLKELNHTISRSF
jgi:xylulokinase